MKIYKHIPNSPSPSVYPFTAIVGQEEMKLALILNVVDPLIGGVLIMGHRGTGKSTAVRALADLLPEISAVLDCPYQCDAADESKLCNECLRKLATGEKLKPVRLPVKIVDLPLGATEDRICGTIDIERALKGGIKSFEPGLLARANRGFLYIDEVNLLEDHLVDLLLDVATTGRNKVERESISIEHPARFVLIGSGNPEEGELRPQLIDRFGLHVEIKTEDDPELRMEIVARRQSFENHPRPFCAQLMKDQRKLRNKIVSARETATAVYIGRPLLLQIAQLCSELKIDGHRGELTITRAARALAAFEGRREVTSEDIRSVAVMSLRHRLRRDPLEEIAGTYKIQRALDKLFPESSGQSEEGSDDSGGVDSGDDDGKGKALGSPSSGQSSGPTGNRGGDSTAERSISADDAGQVMLEYESRSLEKGNRSSSAKSRATRGRNRLSASRTRINYERGRYTSAVSQKRGGARVAIDATLRALAGVGYRVSGALFGLVAVLRFGSPSITALRECGRSASDAPGRHRTRNALVVGQVALALTLLIVSGLMIRTFVAMRQVDPGFTRPEEVQTFVIAIPEGLISDDQHAARTFQSVAERLAQVPGVASVGLSSSITMDGEDNGNPLEVEGVPIPKDGRLRRFKSFAPGYFETMGIRLIAGRSITWSEIHERRRVIVISEPIAREVWGEPARALGKRVRVCCGWDTTWREIVGVTGDERDDGLAQPPTAIVYWPMLNERYPWRTMVYAVRSTRVGTPGFLRELEQAVWAVNPDLPLARAQTVEEIQAHSMAQTSFALVMLGVAAVVALLIGVVGIYGVIAYAVALRTREIGVRMALGAQIADVQRVFLRHGLWLTATGILMGIGVAMVVTRVMSTFLFGVGPMDPVTYAAVSATLAAAALLGTYLPARRATRVDPSVALRAE